MAMNECEALAAREPQPCEIARARRATPGEAPPPQVQQRIARALARNEQQAAAFEQLLRDGFVPGGRIAEAGAEAGASVLPDAFVQPVEDRLGGRGNGLPGIMEALAQVVETLRHGGRVACDFSRLRPAGARVEGADAPAPGPLAWMRLFDRACETVSAQLRGGGHTGVLRVDHPDIERFLAAPRGTVAISDEFMRKVVDDREFELVHAGDPGYPAATRVGTDRAGRRFVYRSVRARALWARILGNAYCTGQPGIVFVDTLNRGNNLWYCERIEAASPDSAQALPAYGCSCKGALDAARFVREPSTERASFDHVALERATGCAVQLLDRVIDVTAWPLAQHAAEAAAKRRIGVGVCALADAAAMLGLRPGSSAAREFACAVARTVRDAAYRASAKLAMEHGAFPLFDPGAYLQPGTLAGTLPSDVEELVRMHGIRNSHLISIDPVDDLATASLLEPFVDAPIGLAVAVPGAMPFHDFEHLHVEAWRLGLAGCSVSLQDRT